MNKKVNVKKETQFAGKKLVFETGQLASMANMSIKVSFGDTVLLATAVSSVPSTEMDFFPLTVVYEEKLYASGTIKSSRFIKRDGRPTDDAIVTRRLIDHAIRPLFPSDYGEEVQVVVTVLSLEPESDPKFLSLLAASAVLHSSDIPFNGPAVTIGVGYKNGEYILCPSTVEEEELEGEQVHAYGAGGQSATRQFDEVRPNLLLAQILRRPVVMACQMGYRGQVHLLRAVGQSDQPHVLDHSLT